MKRTIILLAFTISACSFAPPRTGKIVVNKFAVQDVENKSPIDIRPDVLESIRGSLQKEIIRYIKQDSQMTLAGSCADADYELVGSFNEVDSIVESHFRFVTVTVNKAFEADVEGYLLSCKTGAKLAEFDESEEGEAVPSVIEDMAEDIVADISKDKPYTP